MARQLIIHTVLAVVLSSVPGSQGAGTHSCLQFQLQGLSTSDLLLHLHSCAPQRHARLRVRTHICAELKIK